MSRCTWTAALAAERFVVLHLSMTALLPSDGLTDSLDLIVASSTTPEIGTEDLISAKKVLLAD